MHHSSRTTSRIRAGKTREEYALFHKDSAGLCKKTIKASGGIDSLDAAANGPQKRL